MYHWSVLVFLVALAFGLGWMLRGLTDLITRLFRGRHGVLVLESQEDEKSHKGENLVVSYDLSKIALHKIENIRVLGEHRTYADLFRAALRTYHRSLMKQARRQPARNLGD